MNRVGTGPFMTTLLRLLVVMAVAAGLAFCTPGQQTAEKGNSFTQAGALLDSALDQYRMANSIPGISAAVVFPDDQVWRGASGRSSDSAAVTPELLFGIGSVTKSYVAAVVMKYVEAGRLSLDDPIGKWLPPMPHVDSTITVRQLLNHTSGLFNYMAHPAFLPTLLNDPVTPWTCEALFTTFQEPPIARPGVTWEYSATNYLLLGLLIERLSGQPAAVELSRRLLEPLQLTDTYLYPDTVYPAERMAHLWFAVDETGALADVHLMVPPPPLAGLFSAVWTAGAIHATAGDAAAWMKALFKGTCLSRNSLAVMTTPTPLSGPVQYGLGVMVDSLDQVEALGHSGGIGYSSLAYYVPGDSLGMAVLANSDCDLRPLAAEIRRIAASRGRQ